METNEDIVGFDTEGNPISSAEFIADISLTVQLLKEGRLETLTSEEVKQMIFGLNNI